MKHPKEIENYNGTIQECAKDIAKMDYSSQVEFLNYYYQELKRQAEGDKNRPSIKDPSKTRTQLAEGLEKTALSLFNVKENMIKLVRICKPYMKE